MTGVGTLLFDDRGVGTLLFDQMHIAADVYWRQLHHDTPSLPLRCGVLGGDRASVGHTGQA